MDKRLVTELIKTRQAVKRKYESLKADIAQSQARVAEQFKPISQPLTELLTTIKQESVQATVPETLSFPRTIKRRVSTPSSIPRQKTVSAPGRALAVDVPSTPATVQATSTPRFLRTEVLAESEAVQEENEETQTVLENEEEVEEQAIAAAQETVRQMMEPQVLGQYLEQFEGLARRYIEGLIRDTEDKYDLHYGVRFDIEKDKFAIGNKELQFDGEDVVITDTGNRIVYKGTPGFYELIFKKKPTSYKREDLDNYKDIMQRSSANRANYDPNQRISGNSGSKYMKIVRPLTATNKAAGSRPAPKVQRSGKGLLTVTNKNVEFVPWKDPNSLVDRLRTLLASQVAGHTGHSNEIISVTQALRDAKIIY